MTKFAFLYSTPFRPAHLGGPSKTSDQKNLPTQKGLRILEGSILCKNAKPKISFWQVPAHSGPNILGPTPKLKILLPRLLSPGP
jgi:hypothetical protein